MLPGSVLTGSNLLDTAPAFQNTLLGDFHLGAISPCINAGDPTFQPKGTDIDGEPRVLGGIADLAADERP